MFLPFMFYTVLESENHVYPEGQLIIVTAPVEGCSASSVIPTDLRSEPQVH
jgi:hypothetical protein